MAVAVSFSYGKSCLPGMNTGQPPKATLFLDYESTANTQAQRRRQLVESIGMQIEQGKILYKKMYSPITDAASAVFNLFKVKSISANGTVELLSRDLLLTAGDILKVQAATANRLHVVASITEIPS